VNYRKPSIGDLLQGDMTEDMRSRMPVLVELRSDVAEILEHYPDDSGDSPIAEALCRAILSLETQLAYVKAYALSIENRLREAGVEFPYQDLPWQEQ
jgi:hypothetical protein